MDDPPLNWTAWIVVLAVLFVGAAFAGLNDALNTLGDARLRAIVDSDGKHAGIARRLLIGRGRLSATFLVGRVLCVGLGASLVADRCVRLLAGTHLHDLSLAVGVLGFGLAYCIAAEVATTYGRGRLNGNAFILFQLVRPVQWLMAPLVAPLLAFARLVSKVLPERADDNPQRVAELEVEHLIEQSEEKGNLSQEHAELLLSVLEFKDTVAREVMVPRTQMVAIERTMSLDEVFALVVEKGHSRYPIYHERLDQVEGVLYAKDLFRSMKKGSPQRALSKLSKAPFFAAESQKIGNLLREMQARRVHLAVVVDEFGGTSGLVTLEDILEEIVGEIRDEHDREESPIQRLGEKRYLVQANMSLHDLQDMIEAELPEVAGDHESLGGLINDLAGKVPEVGQALELGPFRFTVREADERHVTAVELEQLPEADPEKAAE